MELNDARRKRAVNMVWTAADRYDFEPQYLFFHGNGEPDLYLNTLEGLAINSGRLHSLSWKRQYLSEKRKSVRRFWN